MHCDTSPPIQFLGAQASVSLCADCCREDSASRGRHGWHNLPQRVLPRLPRRKVLAVLCSWLLAMVMWLHVGMAQAQSVVFINPGSTKEVYWVTVTQVMEQAARSLGMQLEVMYAERNRLLPLQMAQAIAQRPPKQRPDYLILVNENSVAPEVLRLLEGSGIKILMAFSGVQESLQAQTGRPREKYPLWLGSIEPNGFDAGYLTAKAMIAHARTKPALRAPDGKWHMMAIGGARATAISVERSDGMRKAVQEAKDVLFTQEVFGDWRRDRAQEQAAVLFKRYPDVRLVWAGNDLMAFGAMETWRQMGGVPGKDALFSGINTSEEALQARMRGELTALSGGHFMAGGWAMVMVYDHARGIDFASEGLELNYPMFILLDEHNIPRFQERFGTLRSTLDFKAFSKYNHPQLKKYHFDIARLLR